MTIVHITTKTDLLIIVFIIFLFIIKIINEEIFIKTNHSLQQLINHFKKNLELRKFIITFIFYKIICLELKK